MSTQDYLVYKRKGINNMIILERITKNNIEPLVSDFFKRYAIPENFFGHFSIIQTILNQDGKELFLVKDTENNKEFLALEKQNNYRFFFREPSIDFIKNFVQEFKPRYISANILFKPSRSNTCSIAREEIVLDIEKILSMCHSSFRKDYSRAIRLNPKLSIKPFSYKDDVAGILTFLDEWRHSRSEKLNRFAYIENDLNFLVNYGRNNFVKGVIIRDGDKVIAYSLYVPYKENSCVSCYSKVLRGYEKLGVLLTVEKCKYMKEDSFSFMYLGGINNDFKKSLLWAGKTIELYAGELYTFSGMEFRDREAYLSQFF